MILNELLYAFRANLEIEYVKRGTEDKAKFKLNDKQLKLIFSMVVADLQKDFKMILSSQTISSLANEQAYALTRDFMTLHSVYYEAKKLVLKTLEQIYNMTGGSGTPLYYAIKQMDSYPFIIVYPAPATAAESLVVKSYNDMTLYSINDGLDSKSTGTTDLLYMKIPTQYDSAILMGMKAELFEDQYDKYRLEKRRLLGLRLNEQSLDYNMTGVNDDFEKGTSNYNSAADGTPSVIPGDPTYI